MWHELMVGVQSRTRQPSLTRREDVSTLEQSPESWRCGCEPASSGDRAGYQRDTSLPGLAQNPLRTSLVQRE
jgi:hypothetical protein